MIKRRKVRDGVIVNEEITIDLTSSAMPDIHELMKLGGFMSVEDSIRAIQERVKPALTSKGTRSKYAADAIEGFDLALRLMAEITEPKARKTVTDVVYCLQNAYQSLFRTDIKALEPDIVTGVKATKQRVDAGISSGKERTAERKPVWDRWQKEVDRVRKENPKLKKTRVQEIVGKTFGVTRQAIAKKTTW